MSKQQDFHTRVTRIHTNLRPYLPSPPVLAASALLIAGAGLFFALPEGNADTAETAAVSNAPASVASPDESFCDRQAWPYVDQRCAARVDAARGSRQVRIVTDKGNSVKTVTPLPIVEKKTAPQPQPAVAHAAPQIGPSTAPTVANASSEPQTTGSVQSVVAISPSQAAAKAMASAPIPPVSASNAPASPGVDAVDEERPKSKSARAAEKREADKAKKREAKERESKQREAKRRKIEQHDDSADVADATRSLPEERGNRSRGKRARAEVPADVIEAVEAAAARDRGREVSLESPRGRRVYVVPRDDGGW